MTAPKELGSEAENPPPLLSCPSFNLSTTYKAVTTHHISLEFISDRHYGSHALPFPAPQKKALFCLSELIPQGYNFPQPLKPVSFPSPLAKALHLGKLLQVNALFMKWFLVTLARLVNFSDAGEARSARRPLMEGRKYRAPRFNSRPIKPGNTTTINCLLCSVSL